jgi:hypothetical protein
MKGVVIKSFEAFLEEGGHEALADEAFSLESLSSNGAYTNVGNYPASDLISMVVHISETTGQPAGLLVRDFGEYLFHVLASAHADIIKGFSSCVDMLAGIESVIHRDVRKLYSSAELPRFDIEARDGDDSITLVYQSSRPFADLAEGLIKGAFAHYGIKKVASLKRYDVATDGTHSKFEVAVNDGNSAG